MTNIVDAQLHPPYIVLSAPESGSIDHVAQESITFNPGFSFDGNSGQLRAWIEPAIAYSTHHNQNSFVNLAPNTGLQVGSIAGGLNVNDLGAANYNIPIILPIGTNSMEPSLVVGYSSHAGNGQLGVGWGIGGLSSIALSQSVPYFDDETENIRLDGTDKFMLDGIRLFVTSGAYGANNSEYGLEIDQFTKIISYGNGTTPDWFAVMDKNGITTEYGRTGASKINSPNGTTIEWKISKIYDANGNYILYEYDNSNYENRISKIRYTGNEEQNLAPYNEINFTYKTRQDFNTVYAVGTTINANLLLDHITITTNDQLFKEYQFTYGLNGESFLKSIQELGANGEPLNATNFLYGDGSNGIDFTDDSFGHNHILGWPNIAMTYRVIPGFDFNNDGKMDLLGVLSEWENGFYIEKVWRALVLNENNEYSIYAFGTIPSNYFVRNKRKSSLRNSPNLGGDLNGDGITDVILCEIIKEGNISYLSGIQVHYILGPNNIQTVNHSFSTSQSPGIIINEDKFLHIGDFDGDGKEDILILNRPAVDNWNYLGQILKTNVSGTNQVHSLVSHPINVSGTLQYFNSSSEHFITDIDGDGKAEIAGLYVNSMEFFELSSNPPYQITKILHTNFPNSSSQVKPGDFNGDGLTDFLVAHNEQWSIMYSNGLTLNQVNHNFGFQTGTFQIQLGYSLQGDYFNNVYVLDASGNGKSDILCLQRENEQLSGYLSTHSSVNFKIYISTGVDFELHEFVAINESLNSNYNFEHMPTYSMNNPVDNMSRGMIGDINGDGKSAIQFHFGSTITTYNFNINKRDRYLSSVKDGYGNTTNIEYDWLSNGNSYIQGDHLSTSNFPVVSSVFALPIVRKTSSENGIGGLTDLLYNYEDLRIHKQGKGILGFSKLHVTNTESNFKHTRNFSFITTPNGNARMYMIMNSEITTNLNNNEIVSSAEYNNVAIGLGGVRFRPQLTNIQESDFLNAVFSNKSLNYNSNGNLFQIHSTIDGVSNSTSYDEYTSFGSWWFPGLVGKVTTTKSRPNETPYIRVQEFSYDTKGNLTEAINDPSLDKSVISTYNHDVFGNVISTSLSSPGLPIKSKTASYDAQGRYVVSSQNELNQTTTTVVNNLWGHADAITDPTGLTVSFQYDGFGNLISSTDPKGVITLYTKNWDITSNSSSDPSTPNNTLYYSQIITPNTSPTTVWYDILGREVKVESLTPSGLVYSVKKFNEKGLLVSSTEPFFSGGTPNISTTTYDDYNRITESSSGPVITTNVYSASNQSHTLTTTAMGKTSSITKNGLGEVVSASDEGGDLVYSYYASGLLKDVTLNGQIITECQYDEYGRQTQLSDVNAGLTQYDYDAYGNLIMQINANDEVQEMEYDVLGRLITKTIPEGTISYSYIPSGNGLNQIFEIIGYNGANETFTYDEFHRPINTTISFNGQSYTTITQYDIYDNVTSIQYPSGFVVNNNFTSFGSLNEVTDASQNIKYIENPEYNQRGQLIEYALGNGVTTELLYDNYGSLTNITALNIQDYEVGYDYNAGRITNRKDYLKDRFEVFQYDNLNRLTSASTGILSTNTQIDWMVMEYENNGNISSKTGLGSYHYHDEKINAVVDVDNNDLSIPSFNQMITMTSFSRTESIEGFNDDDTYFISFSYDAHHDRIQSQLFKNNEIIKTKLYLGIYEIEYDLENDIERHIHYIPGHNGICAIHVVTNGSNETFYPYTDHLGSIVALTDASGNVVYEQNFDVWGQRRNPETWLYDDYTHNYDFDWVRGFTGHEHHDEFGIINMNNRMYDPVLARMMGADNFVQSPYFSQSYNRYSYVWNNPMSYTDPSGDIVWAPVLIGMGVGIYMGASVANNSYNPAQWTLRPSLIGGGIGAVAGAFGGHFFGKAIAATKAAAINSDSYSTFDPLKANIVSGALNAFYSYDEGQHWTRTLANFGAGFLGGYTANNLGLVYGLIAGGVANVAAHVGTYNSENSHIIYQVGQKLAGGALTAYAGATLHNHKLGYFKYSKDMKWKWLQKGGVYAILNYVQTFAYEDQDRFLGFGWEQHAGILGIGFGSGVIYNGIGRVYKDHPSNIVSMGTQTILKAANFVVVDYVVNHYNMYGNYYGGPFQYNGATKKYFIGGIKSFIFNLPFDRIK